MSCSVACGESFFHSGAVAGAPRTASDIKEAIVAATAATFDLLWHGGVDGGEALWNATETYRQAQDAWGLLERHRSFRPGRQV
ncbi:MAG: hypothetical protein ABR970_12955 [Roseiarcus sp.]|jgi:hypothetical protein